MTVLDNLRDRKKLTNRKNQKRRNGKRRKDVQVGPILKYAYVLSNNEYFSGKREKKNANQINLDDTILTGLQTVIDLCGLLEECEELSKLKPNKEEIKPTTPDDKRFLDNPCEHDCMPSSSQASVCLDDSPNSSKMFRLSSTSINFRKLFTRISRNKLKNKCPSKSSMTPILEQTSAPNQPSIKSFYSQSLQILTSATRQTIDSQPLENTRVTEVARPVSSKKNVSSSNAGAVDFMKPIEEEPQTSSRSAVLSQPHNEQVHSCSVATRQYGNYGDPKVTAAQSSTHCSPVCTKDSVPACTCHSEIKTSKRSLRQRNEEDDIHCYWKSRHKLAGTKPHGVQRSTSLESITKERTPKAADSIIGLVNVSNNKTPKTCPGEMPACYTGNCPALNSIEAWPNLCCVRNCPVPNTKRRASLSTKSFPLVEIEPASCNDCK